MTLGLLWAPPRVALVAGWILAALAALRPLLAQDTSATRDTTLPPPSALPYRQFHVALTINDWGVSFGTAPRVNGVRLNVEDAGSSG